MAGQVLGRVGLKRALAASLLALLTGCAAPPAAPPPVLSSPAPAPVVEEPVAEALPSPSSSLAAARRWLKSLRKSPEVPPVAEAAPEPAPEPERVVDEKYQLTGKAAMDMEVERGNASWYGGRFHGRLTASGETYDKYALTAAHKTLPFGTIVRVRSLTLGREVDVRINDRGPFAPGRVIDLSRAAAEALGLMEAGVAKVSLNVAEPVETATRARKPQRRTSASSRKSAKRNAKASQKASPKSSASAKRKAVKKH